MEDWRSGRRLDGEGARVVYGRPCKCILVTGPLGVGKSTLIMRVFDGLKTSNPNLKVKLDKEARELVLRLSLDGGIGPLASANISRPESRRWPSVGKYKAGIASFESLALPELQVREDTDLFIIDEIGKMELYSSSFFPAVQRVLETNIPILASIPIPKYGRDIPEVARLRNHPTADIHTLSVSNRDAVREEIRSLLVDLLRKR